MKESEGIKSGHMEEQEKKEQRMYFYKKPCSFYDYPEIDFLMSDPKKRDYEHIFEWLFVHTLNANGRLEKRIGEIVVPYNPATIAREIKYFDETTIKNALEMLVKLGLLKNDNGVLRIKPEMFFSMVGDRSAKPDAQRKSQSRANKKERDAKSKECDKKSQDGVTKSHKECDKKSPQLIDVIDVTDVKDVKDGIDVKDVKDGELQSNSHSGETQSVSTVRTPKNLNPDYLTLISRYGWNDDFKKTVANWFCAQCEQNGETRFNSWQEISHTLNEIYDAIKEYGIDRIREQLETQIANGYYGLGFEHL